MLIRDENILAEIACIEPVAAHGLLGVVNLGETFLTCYFRWRPVRWTAGSMIREKVVVAAIEMPRDAAFKGGRIDRWLSSGQAVMTEKHTAILQRH